MNSEYISPFSGATPSQVEESGLHWVLCGGASVGRHTQPRVWRLRPKDERARESQRAKDMQKMAAMARLVREVMQWHSDPESPNYNECEREPCGWCAEAKKLFPT